MSADSGQADHSSERSDDHRQCRPDPPYVRGGRVFTSFGDHLPVDEALWSVWAARCRCGETLRHLWRRAVQRACGKPPRRPPHRVRERWWAVFHSSVTIHRPWRGDPAISAGQLDSTSGPPDDVRPTGRPVASLSIPGDHDFPLPPRRVSGSRMVGPLSVRRWARWINRSQIASATLGSPMAACHAVGGS